MQEFRSCRIDGTFLASKRMIIRELPFDEEKALFVTVRRILTPEMRRSSGVAGVQELQNGRHLSRSKRMIIREPRFDEEKALFVTVRRILTPELLNSRTPELLNS